MDETKVVNEVSVEMKPCLITKVGMKLDQNRAARDAAKAVKNQMKGKTPESEEQKSKKLGKVLKIGGGILAGAAAVAVGTVAILAKHGSSSDELDEAPFEDNEEANDVEETVANEE